MALVLCQRNPYLRQHVARVLRCTPAAATPDLFDVVLDDTVLFPTGGGQPCDFGTIGSAEVVDVVRTPDGVVHRTKSKLEEGSEALVTVDWERRFDHMQQHSAQHLLSALADTHFQAPTTSWGLLSRNCVIDFGNASFDTVALTRLEVMANECIRKAIPVSTLELSPAELETVPGLRSRGLPEGLSVARVIQIGDLDINPCCGTHVRNTAELQLIKFLGLEKKKGGVRVTFVAGGRALALLGSYVQRELSLNKLLGTGGDEHVNAVSRLLDQLKTATAQLRALHKELAEADGRALAATPEPVALYHRDEAAMDFLQLVGRTATAAAPDKLFFLTCGPEKGDGQFLVTGPEAQVKVAGPAVAAALQAKGGGRGSLYQGKCSGLAARRAAVRAALVAAAGVGGPTA